MAKAVPSIRGKHLLKLAVAEMAFTYISAVLVPLFFERSFGISLVNETEMHALYTDLVAKVLGT